MTSFSNIVNSVLNEGFEKDGYLYVYHMTKREALEGGIYKSGFERFYTGKNSNAYGPGVYTTLYPSFDPRAEVKTSYGSPNPDLDKSRGSIYGHVMIKMRAKKGAIKNFLIFDEKWAKIQYKDNWKIEDQLRVLLKPETFNEVKMKYSRDWDYMCNGSELYTRGYGAHTASELCKINYDMNRSIRGYIFHGPGDGFVCIFKDFAAVTPVAESTDYGHTFTPIKLDPKFDEYVTNNVDLRREFGAEYQYDNQTGKKKMMRNAYYDEMPEHFTNGFARIKKDNKYNYLYIRTYKKGPISPVWFDEAPVTFDRNGIARVMLNDEVYKIKCMGDYFVIYDQNNKFMSYLSDFQTVLNTQNQQNDEPNVSFEDDFD